MIATNRTSVLGYERHCQEVTGHGESTPSSGRKFLLFDTEQDGPELRSGKALGSSQFRVSADKFAFTTERHVKYYALVVLSHGCGQDETGPILMGKEQIDTGRNP
jgi:hypothetical protein